MHWSTGQLQVSTSRPAYALVIRSLQAGGAERQLCLLAHALRDSGRKVRVVTFYKGGEFERELTGAGVNIICLNKRARWDIAGFAFRFVKTIKGLDVDIVVGFLEGANILLTSMRPLFSGKKIVNRLATSYMDLRRYDWLSAASFKVELWMAKYAHAVVANSAAGKERAERSGVSPDKLVVVRNAVDTDYFKADGPAARKLRSEWGVPEDHYVIGLVGRLDPMKDHPIFIRAANELQRQRRDLLFICVGAGVDQPYMDRVKTQIQDLVDPAMFQLLGFRSDLPTVYTAMDVNVLSSYGEGSPNSIVEAMACETPCVATDVGDARKLVGQTGEIVRPRDHRSLAQGIVRQIEKLRRNPDLGRLARQKVMSEYSIAKTIETLTVALEI